MEGVRAAMKTRHLEADQWLNRKEWCLGSGRRRQLSQDRKDSWIEQILELSLGRQMKKRENSSNYSKSRHCEWSDSHR